MASPPASTTSAASSLAGYMLEAADSRPERSSFSEPVKGTRASGSRFPGPRKEETRGRTLGCCGGGRSPEELRFWFRIFPGWLELLLDAERLGIRMLLPMVMGPSIGGASENWRIRV